MIEFWYAVMAFMMTGYVLLDGRNFGIGALHLFVARTPAERRQVIAAIGPLWPWHEVWLVSFGGILFVAFPKLYAASFSGYYLALFLVLWCFVLRGISLEVGGHIHDRMWRTLWDVVFAFSSILLGVLFGVAFGDLARGVPVDSQGNFSMAFFTDFNVWQNVGLLDWYTVSMGVTALVLLTAHAATYLTVRTEGPVHDRCAAIARWLWALVPLFFILISIETHYVRPELASQMAASPLAWLAIVALLVGAGVVFASLRARQEMRAFIGSNMVIGSLLAAGAATIFPVILYSTLSPDYSLTAQNTATTPHNMELALLWWPFAFALTCAYWWFVSRKYTGKVPLTPVTDDKQAA
jgi:cytochrome d ubiquinol oxidase subunit II